VSLRTFLAVELSGESRAKLAELAERLRKGAAFTGASLSWTRPEAMHVTIKFLGDIEEGMVGRIAERLEPVCAALPPFVFGVRGLGVFPDPERPRVLWAGARKADEAFARLFRAVEETMLGFGFRPEGRAFRPHLTLARIRDGKGARGLMAIVNDHRRQWCGDTRAERLVLFQSDLRPSGAVHTELRAFPFLAPEEPPGMDEGDAPC